MFKHKAILIIHGFAGGTYDIENLANYLELNKKFDVFFFTLPGHDVKDKRKATSKEWIKESEKQINYLINNGYKNIYLVGHSMGGVIATHLAKKYKEVKKIVLAAPAFTSMASKKEGGVINALFKIPELVKVYSYNEILTRVNKLPVSAEKEFMELIETYKNDIYDIKVPVMFVHGTKDQVVPPTSSEIIFNKINNNHKKIVLVNDYYHDIFKGRKNDIICCEIEKFLKEKNFMIKEEKIEL